VKTNLLRCLGTIALAASSIVFSNNAFAQESFEDSMTGKLDSLIKVPDVSPAGLLLYPDDAQGSIMVPSGFGGSGTYLFGGIGSTYPELYKNNKADLITFGGVSVGDPIKAVNFAAGLNMTDVHRFRDFSANFDFSKQLSAASSISAGGLGLFANTKQSDSPGPTFYIAFSHAVQGVPSLTPGCSALSYTIGIGDGRFLDKSPDDIKSGKGKYGTAVFGSISYEIIHHVNLNAEWYGTNLGISTGIRPFKNPLSVGFGVDDLTRYSGDKASMILTLGYPLSIRRTPAN